MTVKLLTEPHLVFLSLKGGCKPSSESTLDKMLIVGNHIYSGRSLSEDFAPHAISTKILCDGQNEFAMV